jgi:hypothetical protein
MHLAPSIYTHARNLIHTFPSNFFQGIARTFPAFYKAEHVYKELPKKEIIPANFTASMRQTKCVLCTGMVEAAPITTVQKRNKKIETLEFI